VGIVDVEFSELEVPVVLLHNAIRNGVSNQIIIDLLHFLAERVLGVLNFKDQLVHFISCEFDIILYLTQVFSLLIVGICYKINKILLHKGVQRSQLGQ